MKKYTSNSKIFNFIKNNMNDSERGDVSVYLNDGSFLGIFKITSITDKGNGSYLVGNKRNDEHHYVFDANTLKSSACYIGSAIISYKQNNISRKFYQSEFHEKVS